MHQEDSAQRHARLAQIAQQEDAAAAQRDQQDQRLVDPDRAGAEQRLQGQETGQLAASGGRFLELVQRAIEHVQRETGEQEGDAEARRHEGEIEQEEQRGKRAEQHEQQQHPPIRQIVFVAPGHHDIAEARQPAEQEQRKERHHRRRQEEALDHIDQPAVLRRPDILVIAEQRLLLVDRQRKAGELAEIEDDEDRPQDQERAPEIPRLKQPLRHTRRTGTEQRHNVPLA